MTKYYILALLMFAVNISNAKEMTEIIDEIPNYIDTECELHAEAETVFNDLANDVADEINTKIQGLLEQFDLDCLSGILSLGNLNLPDWLFSGSTPSFCDVAINMINSNGSQILSGSSPSEKKHFNEVSEKINQRYLQKQAIMKQLKKRLKENERN